MMIEYGYSPCRRQCCEIDYYCLASPSVGTRYRLSPLNNLSVLENSPEGIMTFETTYLQACDPTQLSRHGWFVLNQEQESLYLPSMYLLLL